MLETHISDEAKYTNHCFTEIFHFIKRYNISGDLEEGFSGNELNIMIRHCDNAITAVLHGLHAFANLVANSALDVKYIIISLSNFFSIMTNLIEALHDLRGDCEFLLKE